MALFGRKSALLFITLLFLFSVTAASAQNNSPAGIEPVSEKPAGPPRVELMRASEAEYLQFKESDEGVLIMSGGIILRVGNRIITAETVKIHPQTGEVYAEGRVELRDSEQIVKGDRFLYDNRTEQAVLYKAETEMEPVYFSGESFRQLNNDTFLARTAFFTTCEAEHPHYTFRAKKLWLYKDNQFVGLHVFTYIGETPVFYLPMMFQTDIGTGIITQYGHNRSRGHFLQNTYYFGVDSRQSPAYVPENGKLMLDWYQRGGIFTGVYLQREAPSLKYDLDLGIADYTPRDQISDGDEVVFTNQVLQADGTRKKTHELWYKVKADIKTQWGASAQADTRSALVFRFEDYAHKNFEDEFSQRYEPDSTVSALTMFNEFLVGDGVRNLDWEALYTEDWQNNHLQVRVRRSLLWYEQNNSSESDYEPVYEMTPDVTFSKRWRMFTTDISWFAGGWNNIYLNGGVHRYFNNGEVLKTMFRGSGYYRASLFFPFTGWLTFTPTGGYGLTHEFARQADAALASQTARDSYQYLFTDSSLRIGYPFFYSNTRYIYRYSFKEGEEDPTFGSERAHAVNQSFISDLNPYAYLSTSASRDMRSYPYELPEQARWSEWVSRGQMKYDFIRGFQDSYFGLRQRKYNHFSGINLFNQYVYFIRFDTPATNDFNISYELGGYKLLFFEELVSLNTGFNWHHNFIDTRQDNMNFSWSVDLLLHPYWRLEMGSNSRVDQVERYEAGNPGYVPFFEDVFRSMNPFDSDYRRNAAFNLETFFAELTHDLHRWVLKLTYSVNRNTVYYGTQLRNRATYYEQTVFFSMNLKDFPSVGIPETQVYRYNPGQDGFDR